MISKVLPVAALAGAAMAAASCPLSVEISGATGHVAQVAITNTGAEAVTVFRGNTVLHDHPTLDVLASSADKDLEFKGRYVNYKRKGLDASAFQTIKAGETVTVSVNVAKTYDLKGVEAANITAIQGFKYVTGEVAPSSLNETSLCDDVVSNTFSISPDQSKVASDLVTRGTSSFNSRIQKRAITYDSSCSAARITSLKKSAADAVTLATNAYTAAGTGAYGFLTWFKSTSETSTVQSIYTKVKGVQTTAPTIYCSDVGDDCGDGLALLYTDASDNYIVPCPNNGFWTFDEYSPTCTDFDQDRAGSLLHEITHLYGTGDWGYGPTRAKALSAALAANNADTYEMYASSVRLGGCT